MFGLADAGVAAALIASVASAALCVVYGLVHWNDAEPPLPEPAHPPGERVDIDDV